MSRIMAIDYGDIRIGIALTDPLKIIAKGYETLENNKEIYNKIFEICKLKEVDSIVIGIPFDADSNIGKQARKVLDFTKKLVNYLLNNNFNIPIYEQDERYTTSDAYDAMKMLKIKIKKKKKIIDQIASAKILSDFMKNSSKKLIDLN